MIGILLALQVNNWNEKRKIKIKETKILKELRSDLAQNIDDIEENILFLKDSQKSNKIILYHIENKIPYNDSLDYHLSNMYPYITFNINQSTYENLRQTGFNLISNDSLRISISDLYANKFSSYRKFENTYLIEHHNNDMKPMFMTEFTSFQYRYSAHPNNYNQFISNQRNREVIFWMADLCGVFASIQSRLKENANELLAQVENEIDN